MQKVNVAMVSANTGFMECLRFRVTFRPRFPRYSTLDFQKLNLGVLAILVRWAVLVMMCSHEMAIESIKYLKEKNIDKSPMYKVNNLLLYQRTTNMNMYYYSTNATPLLYSCYY